MDLPEWLTAVDDQIASRSTPADRAWAWCWVIRGLALRDLLGAPPGTTTDAVWVEPQMAWSMDDLADAGARTDPPTLAAIATDDIPAVIPPALRRLLEVTDVDDPRMPMGLVDACGYAARRAAIAHHAYAGALP
jgi:hypothetical protein